jgi:DNA-binding response OmpR family regulator
LKQLHILLLEDDTLLSEIIEEFLLSLGYKVSIAYDGNRAEELAYSQKFDLFILDVNVPYVNGFEFLKALREVKNETPAIFITSLNDPKDMREAFDSGGDDFIKKPFELSELELRIENVKKHFRLLDDENIIKIDKHITLDLENHLIIKDNKDFKITKKDLEVLVYLTNHSNRVVSLEEIGVNIWSYDLIPSDATIRTYIKNIRKIIGEEMITNLKGAGYRFNKK